MYQAVKYKKYSHVDYYIDGGVLCNYPIHCFDGELYLLHILIQLNARLRQLKVWFISTRHIQLTTFQ